MKNTLTMMTVLLACLAAAPVHAGSAQDQKAVADAMARYTAALEAGPSGVATIAGSFAPEGELLEPGMEPLRGPEAIRKFLEPLVATATVRDASATSETVDVHGDTAYQWGRYSQTVAVKGQPAAKYQGRYVAEWVRVKGGAWKMRRMLVQPAPAAANKH